MEKGEDRRGCGRMKRMRGGWGREGGGGGGEGWRELSHSS
jgi:hypothetical protein